MTRSNADASNHSRQQRTVLLATDQKNSVLAEIGSGNNNRRAYSAYGYQSAERDVVSCLGFNGELRETSHWYFLGNGYRTYNSNLMRFHSPDSWSPFGKGGLNAYGYCGGDPRNFTDPTGHAAHSFLRMASRLSPPTPPRILPIANINVAPRMTPPLAQTQTLSINDVLGLPPSYSRATRQTPYAQAGLPSYDEAMRLSAPTPLGQTPPATPRQSITLSSPRTPTRPDTGTVRAGSSSNAFPLPGSNGVTRHPNGLEVGIDVVERMSLSDPQRMIGARPPQPSNPRETNTLLRRS